MSLNWFITLGIKSNLPLETAPDVITISVLDFICFDIWFLNNFWSLSLIIFWTLKLTGKLLIKEFKYIVFEFLIFHEGIFLLSDNSFPDG